MHAIHTVFWKNCCVSYLAHAVVCELDVSFMVQENVVQLQVAVDDALFMQEVQSNTDFSSIKSVEVKSNTESDVSDLSCSVAIKPKISTCTQENI